MSWYKKAQLKKEDVPLNAYLFKNAWGQIPLIQDPERINDDGYQTTPPYGRQPRKKDMLQKSLGFGSSEHNPSEISGEDSAAEISGAGKSDQGVNSLTSGYDDIVNKGEITDEDVGGSSKPRTEFQGGASVGDPPIVLGMEPSDYTPDIFLKDNNPKQVAIQNALKNIHYRKHRKVNIGNNSVNVVD